MRCRTSCRSRRLGDRRRFKACLKCDKNLFESQTNWPTDHPLAGEICLSGMALPEAARVTWVLMDGSVNDQELCLDCLPILPSEFPSLWRKVMKRHLMTLDPQFRKMMSQPELNSAQRIVIEQDCLRLWNNKPIGVVAAQRWREVMQ